MIDSKNASATVAPMWQGLNEPLPMPDTSMLPPADQPASTADALLKRAVQGAHTTLDRLADSIAPTVRQIGESVAGAEDALQMKTDEFRETRDQWSEALRIMVRNHPLASLAGALALGVLLTRIAS